MSSARSDSSPGPPTAGMASVLTPDGVANRSPPSRSAARCAPRAVSTTSCPALEQPGADRAADRPGPDDDVAHAPTLGSGPWPKRLRTRSRSGGGTWTPWATSTTPIFLTYLEEGRDAFYASVLGAEPLYVVVRIEIDLRAEVRYPEREVTVQIVPERLGTTSMTTRELIVTPSGDGGRRGARGHGPLGPRRADADPVHAGRARAADRRDGRAGRAARRAGRLRLTGRRALYGKTGARFSKCARTASACSAVPGQAVDQAALGRELPRRLAVQQVVGQLLRGLQGRRAALGVAAGQRLRRP